MHSNSIGYQPAFPIPDGPEDCGMTYRQWLIGMALMGLTPLNHATAGIREIAKMAIACADAVISELDAES